MIKLSRTTYLTPSTRVALLQHGGLRHHNGKTGMSLMRFGGAPVVAVIDDESVGESVEALTGIACAAPVVATLADALAFQPEVLVIGIAPSGGALTEEWLQEVEGAAKAGLSIVNGLHEMLATHPRIEPHLGPGQWVWDIRQEPQGLSVGSGAARELSCLRVLTVGTDMAVGKMSASIALHGDALGRGLRSHFVASGQTGMMLAEHGIPLDAIRVDFASGAVEGVVCRAAAGGADIVFVEGQGSLCNPASTATLPLMRGTQPTHQILVHRAGQVEIGSYEHVLIPPLSKVIALCEAVAAGGGAFAPAPVAGIALNTWGLDDAAAQAAIAAASAETGRPCTDPIRFGAGPLLDAILATPTST